jgi:hypothetical protein
VVRDEALQRLRLAVDDAWEAGGRPGHGRRRVAATASPRIETPSARHARGQRLLARLEYGPAVDHARRDRHLGAARGEVGGDGEGRALGVAQLVVTANRLGVGLE